MTVRLIVGLALTVVAAAIALRRLWYLYRLAMAGQPAPPASACLQSGLSSHDLHKPRVYDPAVIAGNPRERDGSGNVLAMAHRTHTG